MEKNIQILLVAVVFLFVGLGVGAGITYFVVNGKVINDPATLQAKQDAEIKKQQYDKMVADYNAQFPDVVTGVISMVSDQKTTIKLANGVEYLISPARPIEFYTSSNIKNGNTVEIRGKIIDSKTLSLGTIVVK